MEHLRAPMLARSAPVPTSGVSRSEAAEAAPPLFAAGGGGATAPQLGVRAVSAPGAASVDGMGESVSACAASSSGERASLLLTPGPLTTSATVKASMMHDAGSRDPAFLRLTAHVRARLELTCLLA